MITPSIKPSEWRFVAVVIFVVLTLTSLPYVFAELSAPDNRHFMGFILNVSDHSQYLAWYKAFQYDNLISNNLTSESNPPLFFNLLWWSLARFGYYSGLSYVIVYQIFRWLAGIFFLIVNYLFCAYFFEQTSKRIGAFLVIVLGTGFGWVLVVLKYTLTGGELLFPLDVYIAEGNSFLCILAYPHFAEACGLIMLVLWFLLIGQQQEKLVYAVCAGIVAFLLGWQHTYDLLIVWAVPSAYTAARLALERRVPRYWAKSTAIVMLLSWPPALYSVLLTKLNPIWKEVLAQFGNADTYSPSPTHMLILMGLPLVIVVITIVMQLAKLRRYLPIDQYTTKKEFFVVVWFFVGWILVYIPTDYQVHMISSWQIPIAILAMMSTYSYIMPMIGRYSSKLASVWALNFILVALVVPTNIYLLTWRFIDLNRHEYPFYLHRDDIAAMQWFDRSIPADSIVFSAYDTGRYIPGISGKRAFLGHWAQTVDFFNKRDLVAEFFAEQTKESRRKQILQRYGVNYILYGPAERALGTYVPDRSSYLELVFTSSEDKVYAVKLVSNGAGD